jgi:feruloyl esterase
VTLTRPLCAYPKQAVYDGQGDPNDAASFRCE